MHGTNLLKKVLKPRNLTPTAGQSSSKKDNVPSRRSSSAGATDSSGGARSPGGKPTCTCSPTTHAGSFRCRLHRAGNGRSHGLTPSAMPKPDGPKKPFKGSSSYTISSVDIHAPQSRPAVPRPAPAAAAAKNKHRGKPSRLSRMAKASPVSTTEEIATGIGDKLDEKTSGFVDDAMAAGNERLVRPACQQRCQSSEGVYAFDSGMIKQIGNNNFPSESEFYPFQKPRETESPLSGSQSPKLTPRGSDFQCDVTEMYTRLFAAQQTTDFISSTEVDALYDANPKIHKTRDAAALRDRKFTAEVIDDDSIPVFDLVSEVVEESKLYVEPLRIIDFKQEFFPSSTCTSFLVQWENLSVRDATWESSHFISGYPKLLQDFLQRRSEQGDSVEFFRAMENVKNLKGFLDDRKQEDVAVETPEDHQRANDPVEIISEENHDQDEEDEENFSGSSDDEEQDEEEEF
ncbi:hypothetical protein SELMODRAFT_422737 [Selaginella moellendorffii]|uniref:Chromo domain-containing protein n=1 Tax=Selaginella moellendorffii TaxID=88036 RepID=D8SJE0_SELML|nr:hypothetical protein SELMODRAFT_422737 [Selaginella moellendorffii]